MGVKLAKRCTDGPSRLHTHEYTAHIESILVLLVLAVRTVSTDEVLPVLGSTHSTDPRNTKSSVVFHSIEPRNTASMAVPAVQNLEILGVLAVCRSI